METHVVVDSEGSVTAFVNSWTNAATNAQGQAAKVCAELLGSIYYRQL